MDDVLPKPFTKEGLIHVLNKYLGHLKKPETPMEEMGPPSSQPIQPTKHQISANPNIKEESPAKSPVVNSNWSSPKQMTGVSPVAAAGAGDEFMVQHDAANFGIAGGVIPAAPFQNASPTQGVGQRQHAPLRRHYADMAGGDDTGTAVKRQQIYLTPVQQQAMGSLPAKR